jgi:hypothetical protein
MKAFRQLQYPTSPEQVAAAQVQDAGNRLAAALWGEE